MITLSSPTLAPVHVPAGTNANGAPTLNILGMPVDVKIRNDQTNGQFSAVEVTVAPFQMGPPPHVHYDLDEIARVLEGTVTVLCGDEVVELHEGDWHLRPRGIVHTFWNAHDKPARFIDMYPGQAFNLFFEEFAAVLEQLRQEGVSPASPEFARRCKEVDDRYNHEVFYHLMPEHMAKYGPTP